MIKNSARKRRVSVFPWIATLLLFSFVWPGSWAESGPWRRLDQGLYMGEFKPTKKSEICERNITILRIDPKFYDFKLLCASEHDRKARTVKQWATEFGLVAAINAGMYQGADFLKSTGYMKNYKHVNNSHVNRSFGAFLVFNPADPSLPDVQIIDRRLQESWRTLIKKYNTVIQNYRMISRGKKRGWPPQQQIASAAAIGMDRNNHVLFIISQAPYSVHDLIHILLALPIQIESAMYLEGGPQAALFFKAGHKAMTLFGDCEEDLSDVDAESGCDIPNLTGIVKRR